MRRRDFLALPIAVAAEATRSIAAAQPLTPRIAILGPAEEPRFSDVARGLRRGLVDQGYVEAKLEVLERRVARGDPADARAALADLQRERATVLFAIGF